MGRPGTNSSTQIDYYPAVATGVNFETPGGRIIIGQAHGHPTSTSPGMVTLSAMSETDIATSVSRQIPIYGVDAMSGSGRFGVPANINRANPNGTTTNNIGNTLGTGNNINPNPFGIGLDALRIWGASGPPMP